MTQAMLDKLFKDKVKLHIIKTSEEFVNPISFKNTEGILYFKALKKQILKPKSINYVNLGCRIEISMGAIISFQLIQGIQSRKIYMEPFDVINNGEIFAIIKNEGEVSYIIQPNEKIIKGYIRKLSEPIISITTNY